MSGVVRGPMLSPLGFDLRSLEAFVVTCRKGSMRAAAQRLSMSQPAISQIIKCLGDIAWRRVDRSEPSAVAAHRKRRFPARSSGRFACRCSAHSLAAARNRKRISAGPAHRDCRFTRIALRAGSPLEFQPSLQTLSVAAGLAGALREGFVDSPLPCRHHQRPHG